MSAVFFTDGVIANSVSSADGTLLEYHVRPESRTVLERLRERGTQMGLILRLNGQPQEFVGRALDKSGLLSLFDPELVIHSDGFTDSALTEAAERVGPPAGRSLLVSEDCGERVRALGAGFGEAVPHPSLVPEVTDGGTLAYVRVSQLGGAGQDGRLSRLLDMPLAPLYFMHERGGTAYAVTSTRVAEELSRAGFDVTVFGGEHDPQLTDLYLAHDDRETPVGRDPAEYATDFLAREGKARFILDHAGGVLVLALPPETPIEEIHFPGARHGHNRRLLADRLLLTPLLRLDPAQSSRSPLKAVADFALRDDEAAVLKNEIRGGVLKKLHAPYVGDEPLDESGHKITTRHFASEDNKLVTRALAKHLERIGGELLTVELHDCTLKGVPLNNVVAELPGSVPGEIVIVSAHLDSTAALDLMFDPAPGADDDASGVAAVLAAATAAVKLRAAGQFRRTLRFVLFNAEEEYIHGSQVYAALQKRKNADIVAVFQMDMIGHTGGTLQKEFEVHVGCLNNPQAEEGSLALAVRIESVVTQVSQVLATPQIYPGTGGYDPLDNKSDHTSFQSLGYRACVVTEDGHEGPLLTSPPPRPNHNYHKQSDKEIDYDYAAEIARVVAAAAILTAKG
ncbi:MAG TPA: M28 family peptidase [Pyrinomonadaceae bacterium]|nr:M28 family peptidase [Pyrinomonadaceae bacterium]